MKLIHLTLSAAVALIFFSCSKTTNPAHDLAIRIDSLFDTAPDFSGVVLVAENGVPLYHHAFGLRSAEAQIPLDTGDIFELASVSKQFTSMIIMMLKEEGKLSYEDSLLTYLPELPYHGITIRHLLTHTSGLPDYQNIMDAHWDKSKVAGNEDNIEYLVRYNPPTLFKAGSAYEYSNTGYMVLASIAEKVSGTDFTELCRSRIFKSLGLSYTDIRSGDQKKSIINFARGQIYVEEKDRYVSADSFPEFNYAIWLGKREGPGRISSTSGDLLKWDNALYTEKLVKRETLEEAFQPMQLTNGGISNYGFGWEISTSPRWGSTVSHTGSNPGYENEIVRYIDRHRTIILLNNNAHERKDELMNALKNMK